MKDTSGIEVPPPARKTNDLEAGSLRTVDGVKSALRARQDALAELVDAIRQYRKLADKTPLTLQGANFAKAVEQLNAAIDQAEGLLSP